MSMMADSEQKQQSEFFRTPPQSINQTSHTNQPIVKDGVMVHALYAE